MRRETTIWMHWALCALALVAAVWLVVLGYTQLDRAFEAGELTRRTLYEMLLYAGAVLALLWAAGWVVASRPKPPPRVQTDGSLFA